MEEDDWQEGGGVGVDRLQPALVLHPTSVFLYRLVALWEFLV